MLLEKSSASPTSPSAEYTPAVDMVVEQRFGPEFFELYRIPLLRGRTFAPGDTWREVIVGERLAAALWPGLDPIGRTFTRETRLYRVIGLAREIHYPSHTGRRVIAGESRRSSLIQRRCLLPRPVPTAVE